MRAPFDGAVEEPGQGVRALHRRRRGAARQRRVLRRGAIAGAHERRARRRICFSPWRRSRRVIAISQKLAARRGRGGAARCARSGSTCTFCPATAPSAVAPVAEALGIAQWLGELKPAEKIALIEALQARRAAAC